MTATRRDLPPHPFWDFSLRVYGSRGVAEACLALQEKHGIDVNVLLFCCWCGESGGGTLPPRSVRTAASAVSPWHDGVVRALRAIRRRLKEGFADIPAERVQAVRKAIAASEIEAEHIEQLLLTDAVAVEGRGGGAPEARAADAAANLIAYLRHAGVAPGADEIGPLKTVLAAAVPDISAAAAARLLADAAARP